MATTVVSTIGSGGDYSTPQAWEDAAPASLVVVDQVWEGRLLAGTNITSSSTILSMSGSTSDATRFKRFTTAPGASFKDHANRATNALFPDAANGILLTHTGGSTVTCVDASESYSEVIGLQIVTTNEAGGKCINVGSTATVYDSLFASASVYTLAQQNGRAVNCLFARSHSASNQPVVNGSSTTKFNNCTVAIRSDSTLNGRGVTATYGHSTYTNLAIFTNGADCANGTGSYVNCATDKTSPPTGFTTVTYADCFVSSVAPYDFRLKAGSPLIGIGAVEATYALNDVMGVSRGAAWDIGAWEYASAGGATQLVTASSLALLATLSQGSVAQGVVPHSITAANSAVSSVLASGTITSSAIGTLVISDIREWETDAPLSGQSGLIVDVYSIATGALLVRLSGQTTDPVTGDCTINHASIQPLTTYTVVVRMSSNKLGIWDIESA